MMIEVLDDSSNQVVEKDLLFEVSIDDYAGSSYVGGEGVSILSDEVRIQSIIGLD